MSDDLQQKNLDEVADNTTAEKDTKDKSSGHNLNIEKKKLFSKKCKNCEQREHEALEYKAGWQRAHADYQNLLKEMDTKKHEWLDWSKQQIVEDFIPVFDNFKKAFKDTEYADSYTENADNADVKRFVNWKKGIGFIMKQFEDILKGHGVEEIKTVGEQFDPGLHEAVAEEESDQTEGVIIKEADAGYRMNGKVIKVAKVIVSK